MRRLSIVTVLVAVCVSLLATPALAKSSGLARPLVVTEIMTAGLPDHPDTWFGSVAGDISGTQEGWGCAFDPGLGAVDPIFLGGAGPGYNVYVSDRGVITQYNFGVFIDGTWEFRNVGLVTEATGDWAYLLGWVSYAVRLHARPSHLGRHGPRHRGRPVHVHGLPRVPPPAAREVGQARRLEPESDVA